MSKIMVLLSGGIDSTTCLAMARDKHPKEDVIAVCLYYGQKLVVRLLLQITMKFRLFNTILVP